MTYTHLLMADIDAIWMGPSGYTLPDGTVLYSGVTVCKVGEDEATLSDNWSVSVVEATKRGKVTDDGDTK